MRTNVKINFYKFLFETTLVDIQKNITFTLKSYFIFDIGNLPSNPIEILISFIIGFIFEPSRF